jgi:hypothetical protein
VLLCPNACLPAIQIDAALLSHPTDYSHCALDNTVDKS